MEVKLTDENWLQIVTFITQDSIPIESVSEVFGVTRKDIQEHITIFKELDPCVSSRAVSGVMPIEEIEATWVTASELRLLGLKIRGLGVKKRGRVLLPLPGSLVLAADEIVKIDSKRHALYNVPESVLRRLWFLRPGVAERRLRIGDDFLFELLMKRLSSFKSCSGCHWTELDLKNYKLELIRDRDGSEEKAKKQLRNEAVRIEDKQISEYEGE